MRDDEMGGTRNKHAKVKNCKKKKSIVAPERKIPLGRSKHEW
jgi:hypothetical protein